MNIRDFALNVTKKLQNAGYQALWAGGCVRDDLLGIEPSDFDVATNATPKQVRKLFGYNRTLSIGAAFGVITVLGPKPVGQIEVATFRRDGTYSDGRHPDAVEFTDAREDALRRDFTINGMFYDPIRQQVIDFVGGQQDLANQKIRAIGDPDKRIDEDKLRMLRAVRFAARFEYELETSTFASIGKHKREILKVSGERIAAEFQKMLLHPNRVAAIDLLNETGLLDVLVPELTDIFVDQRQNDDTRRLLNTEFDDFSSALVRLVYAHAEPEKIVQRLCSDWRLSNEQKDSALFILSSEGTIRNSAKMPWSKVHPIVTNRYFSAALSFANDLADVRILPTDGIQFCREKQSLPPKELDPPHLIDGNDLKHMQIEPGPIFKNILQTVRDKQLDGEIVDRDAALALARNIKSDLNN